jgi:hypothetical protein
MVAVVEWRRGPCKLTWSTIDELHTRGTYAGLLMATSESNLSYRRWSISASSYAKVIDEFAKAMELACLVTK